MGRKIFINLTIMLRHEYISPGPYITEELCLLRDSHHEAQESMAPVALCNSVLWILWRCFNSDVLLCLCAPSTLPDTVTLCVSATLYWHFVTCLPRSQNNHSWPHPITSLFSIFKKVQEGLHTYWAWSWNALDSYSGGVGFKSRPGYQFPWLRLLAVFLSLFR
jgi:hypothetical protein